MDGKTLCLALFLALPVGLAVAAPPTAPQTQVDAPGVPAGSQSKPQTVAEFVARLHFQKGKVVVPAGKSMSDKDLLSLTWFVEGVEGDVPK